MLWRKLAPTGRHKRNLKRAAGLGQTQTTLAIQFKCETHISSPFFFILYPFFNFPSLK